MPRDGLRRRRLSDRGAALVVALLAVALLSALGLALMAVTTTEMLIAGNYRTAQEAFYAAEAALERALSELTRLGEWSAVTGAGAASGFTDGGTDGQRVLADGSILDLAAATNLLNCGKLTACSVSDLARATDDRPWGANNPRWHLYAHAPLGTFLPSSRLDSLFYAVVWVAEDSVREAREPQRLMVRAEARGPGGARRIVEATLDRESDEPERTQVVAWREIR